MPIYEFVCPKCGKIEELLKSSQDVIKCPTCGSAADREISAPDFCVKGSCSNPMAPKKIETVTTQTRKRVLTDWECTKCGEILEDEFVYPDDEILCPKCKGKMKQLIGGNVRYKLTYNPRTDVADWNGNTSQYWSAVKAARRAGRNVRACNEV